MSAALDDMLLSNMINMGSDTICKKISIRDISHTAFSATYGLCNSHIITYSQQTHKRNGRPPLICRAGVAESTRNLCGL